MDVTTAEGLGAVEVVGGEHHGGTGVRCTSQHTVEQVPTLGVESGVGLVEQPQPGPAGHQSGERNPSSLAGGQPPHPGVGQSARHTEVAGRRLDGTGIQPGCPGEEPQIVGRSEVLVQATGRTEEPDLSSHPPRVGGHVHPQHDCVARCHPHQTGAQPQHGRLPRSVGSHQRHQLAAGHVKVDAGECVEAPEHGDDLTERDVRSHGDLEVQRHRRRRADPQTVPPPRWRDQGDPTGGGGGDPSGGGGRGDWSVSRVAGVSWRTVLGAVGRLLIAAGAVLLLFVAYQLWGTGVQTRAAQDRLTSTFDSQLAEVDRGDAAPEATLANLQTGDPVGRLQIPKIGVDYIVLEGVDLGTLESGPGHFPDTPLPGQPGNSAIAGHRATYDAPFNLLNEMVPGDEILMTTVQGTFRYEVLPNAGAPEDPPGSVYGYRIVSPTALEILDDKGDDRLTLMGCHPRYGSSQRIVVEARLVSDTAPPTPLPPTAVDAPAPEVDPGGELLRGESGGWGPVVAWSAGVVAACAVVLLAAHRWRRWRWAFYVLAVAPVGFLLFGAFGAVTNLSPVAY